MLIESGIKALEFIQAETDLYVLAILALYFQHGQAEKDGIKKSDIDPEKLNTSRIDLKIVTEDNRIYNYLWELLRDGLSAKIREKSYYEDFEDRLRAFGYIYEVLLCVMEIPEEHYERMSVNDFIKFVKGQKFTS